MIWEAMGAEVAATSIGMLDPEEVLYEFDGPKLYIARHEGKPLLVYESKTDDVAQIARLIAVPTSERLISELKQGDISVFDALNQPWLHAVDQSYGGHILRVWHLPYGIQSVPTNARPRPQTRLWPHLERRRREKEAREMNQALERSVHLDTEIFKTLVKKTAKVIFESTPYNHVLQFEPVTIAAIDDKWHSARLNSFSHVNRAIDIKAGQLKIIDPFISSEIKPFRRYFAALDIQAAQGRSICVPADFSLSAWRSRVQLSTKQ